MVLGWGSSGEWQIRTAKAANAGKARTAGRVIEGRVTSDGKAAERRTGGKAIGAKAIAAPDQSGF